MGKKPEVAGCGGNGWTGDWLPNGPAPQNHPESKKTDLGRRPLQNTRGQDLRMKLRFSVKVLPWSAKVQTSTRWLLSGIETLSETMWPSSGDLAPARRRKVKSSLPLAAGEGAVCIVGWLPAEQ